MIDGGNSDTHRTAGGGLAEIGAMLRDRRVELKHDIATVARQTRIKAAYLSAIEEGRRRDLPGTAYTIGFVRTYADYLGFDGNRLVNDFHTQLAGDRKRAVEVQAAAEPPRMTISPVGIAAGVLTLAMIAFFTWGYLSDTGREADEPVIEDADEVAEAEEAPADADGAEETAALDPEATPEPALATPTDATAMSPDQAAAAPVEDQLPPEAEAPTVPEPDPAPVQEAAATEAGQPGKIVLRARLESWVQITNPKGESILSRVLRAGETFTVPEEPGLMMTTGNAGGIDIVLDDKKLKSLGSVGLVRRNIPLDPQKLRDGSAFEPATSAQGG